MELREFVASHVSAGQPLTAQAWNEIVDAIDWAYQVIAAARHTVRVKITNPGLALGGVRVTALRAGAPPIEALKPIAPDSHHVLAGLEPGAYEIRVEAPAFAIKTESVTVSPTQAEITVEIALSASGALMPDLFGLTLQAARTELASRGIVLGRLIDFVGGEYPPSNPGADAADNLVLAQNPAAGAAVAPGRTASIVIAMPVEIPQNVVMPSLAGLTESEAERALAAIGLRLGMVTQRRGA